MPVFRAAPYTHPAYAYRQARTFHNGSSVGLGWDAERDASDNLADRALDCLPSFSVGFEDHTQIASR